MASIETEPLRTVQLDGLVVLKIIKHCRESYPIDVTGQLLGLDDKGVLEVTNCFPFPADGDEDASAQYQLDMMRCLRAVNVDNNTVGWYRSAHLGNFVDLSLIETQYSYQNSLSAQSVVLIHDVSKSAAQGNLSLRAFRLQDNFMKAYESKKFTTESLAQAKLSFSNIFEELPVEVHNSHLVTLMLHNIEMPKLEASRLRSLSTFANQQKEFEEARPLAPNFDVLELELDPFMQKNLQYLLDCADVHQQEQNNYQYWQRTVAREQGKMQAWLAKRKQENAQRAQNGQPPLPEDEVNTLFRLPPEPSRLDSMILSAQMHNFTKQINQFAGPSLARLYSTQELQK
ncbi:eukaryotic translation initiation factor 3 subunit H [Cokeromyces recurvatus]|uniref:eukaryotic translation initiation factor 3 subunit H n=1 Tax=Cokeromyces recurvatus TaxID=90255 RepID=UPI00221E5F52|nr:eukaryotic translation initiation factor 3 subunit H [Cokeromyces recurvatus]KAI7905381.1 eukaryotic translation initiation factor 3 subunit H [Cokeromyces recurvatus]